MSWTTLLLEWYSTHQRNFPWRETTDPYKVWLSEIILQQTRTQQGLPYYLKFIGAFPKINDLAQAHEKEVLKLWQGLGYYSRARNLLTTAKTIVNEYSGQFPTNFDELLKLKGIGDYTASAIVSISFDQPKAVVDGNVYRLLSRCFGIDEPINTSVSFTLFKSKAQQLIDPKQPGNFNQALMEFGALQCIPKNPNCSQCVFQSSCYALQNDKVHNLPVKLKKIKIQKRYFNYLVFLDKTNQFILEQRFSKGIWQQLYQFPLWESNKNLKKLPNEARKKINDIFSWKKWNKKPILHKLSHQELHLTFWIAKSKKNHIQGVTHNDLQDYPVPVALQNFINEFFENS